MHFSHSGVPILNCGMQRQERAERSLQEDGEEEAEDASKTSSIGAAETLEDVHIDVQASVTRCRAGVGRCRGRCREV